MLPLPAVHTAPATTSEQFARAVRNAALHNLDAELRATPRGSVIPGAVVLDGMLDSLARCTAELERAEKFAPDDPAPAELVEKLRTWYAS